VSTVPTKIYNLSFLTAAAITQKHVQLKTQ